MKFKRALSLIVATVICGVFITSCSSNSNTESSPSGEKITKLKWYTIGQSPNDLDKVLAEANKYLGEKIGVNLDMTFIDYGDYTQKLSVIITAGENYDLAFTCSWAGDYLGNSRKGAFLDITPYLDTIGKDMKQIIDQRFWDGAEVDGKIFAVPNQKEISTAPMWAFTKEYVDKYNVPYQEIKTLQDLEPWLKIIKENEPNVVPFYITKQFSAPKSFDELVEPIGIKLDGSNELKIENVFETDEMRQNLDTLRKYYKLGYINADSATAQDDKTVKRFVTKGDGQPYADVIWSKDLKYDVVATQMMDAYVTNASTTGSMIGISKNTKNPEKSVEFLNLLNTDPYIRNLLNYGIEGTHYEKVEDNKIRILDDKNYVVGYYTLGNMFLTYPLQQEPTTKWDEFVDFNNSAKNSPALGFKFNTSPVRNELSAIFNVLEEYKQVIYSGSVDIDEYLTKFNAKLKEQGIEKVIADVQKQIDEWSATK